MKNKSGTSIRRYLLPVLSVVIIVAWIILRKLIADGTIPKVQYGTFWSLVPPFIAIILALITKEVYSSLFVGIAIGGMLFANFEFEGSVNHVFNDGFIAVLCKPSNVGILVFLVILGTIVALMNQAGGSAAFGNFASRHIKTKVGAQLATIFLGVLIFIDDYFNCLTVGSVMRPVTDRHNVSREKLAFLIDATAAPICIISPISSWAAAVCGFVDGEDGFSLFIRAIPYNFYAILMIVFMFTMVLSKTEFGPMAQYERQMLSKDFARNVTKSESKNSDNSNSFDHSDTSSNPNGKVIDLVIPIICLIVCCVIGMIYTGGFFSGESFVDAFSNCDASYGLAVGSFFGLIFTIILYRLRDVLSFHKCMDCITDGFRAMVPAILILTMAWTLKSMTDSIGAKEFVAENMSLVAGDLKNFLPAVIFLVGCFLAFATGTSWGTFGILIPIVVAVFKDSNQELMLISISACMAGAVCGDHCSPISDTTIMASAGAECKHLNHVSTQLPYAVIIAAISFVSYVIAGFVQNIWIALPIAFMITALTLAPIIVLSRKSDAKRQL